MKKFLLLLLLPVSLAAQTIRPVHVSHIQWTELTTAQEAGMTLAEGSFWYNTDLNCVRLRLSASSVCILEAGGASDAIIKTPTADQRIAGNFNLFAAKIHNIRFVDPSGEFTTIASAIANLPAAGGIVFSNSPETFTADPFASVPLTQRVTLFLGHGVWLTDVQIVVPDRCRTIGVGRGGIDSRNTVIRATANFPANPTRFTATNANNAVVILGDPDTSAAVFGVRVENLGIDGGSRPNSIGLYSNHINEQAGWKDIVVTSTLAFGILVEFTTGDTPQNFSGSGFEIFADAAATSSYVGLGINLNFGPIATIDNFTVNTVGAVSIAGIAVQLDGITGGRIATAHMENLATGIQIGATRLCAGLSFAGISGQTVSTNMVDLIEISNATASTNLFFSGLNKALATNIIDDQIAGILVTDASLASYSVGISDSDEARIHGDLNHDGSNVGFFAVTPVARPAATDDIKDALVNLGLLQGTSVSPLNLDGGRSTAGRFFSDGTALVAGDFALSAGWGTTASVGTITGNDQWFQATITSAGTGQGANPTATLTFKDGTWTNAPIAICQRADRTNQAGAHFTWTTTATTLVLTFGGTPVATETFVVACHVGGV